MLLFFSFNYHPLVAQRVGSNPPKVNWQLLETDSLRIIFPEELRSDAYRVDSLVGVLMENARYSIGNKQKKLTILLQNQQVISNGYVTLAPFRSEFFTSPLQQSNDLGSLPSIDLLSLHEYRHAQQFSNTLRGITKGAYGLFGETGWNLMSGLIVPDWFWEGDAVYTETLFSKQGRGRIPAFHNQVKALTQGRRFYSYMKMRNGSYNDYLPDHYAYGYFLVSYGIEKYGTGFWKTVLAESSAGKGILWPFASAVKRQSGLRPAKFYRTAFRQLNDNWNKDTLRIVPSETHRLPVTDKRVTSYHFPRYINDTTLLVYKSGYNEVPRFVMKNILSGKEIKLARVFFTTDAYFSCNNKQLVYSALRPDSRFENRSYMDVVLLDLQTGRQKFITKKGKYFSPCISSGGDSVLVVKQNGGQKNSLVLLNIRTGEEVKIYLNPSGYTYQYPQLSVDGSKIYSLVRNSRGEMGIVRIITTNGQEELIFGFTNNILSDPLLFKDSCFLFQASFNGRDNIYGLKLSDNTCYQYTNRIEGCYQPALSPNGEELVYVAFETSGFRLFLREFAALNDEELYILPLNSLGIFEQNSVDFSSSASSKGNERKDHQLDIRYKPFRDFIRIHSWSPAIEQRSYGVKLFSNNYLNTFVAQGGITYNFNEKSSYYNAQLEYGKYYPVFFINADYSPVRNSGRVDASGTYSTASWKEQSLDAGIRIPLLAARARYRNEWTSDIFYRHLNFSPLSGNTNSGTLNLAGVAVRWTHALRKAYRIPVSRFAQFLDVNLMHALSDNKVWRLRTQSAWSFPGFFKTHTWVLEADYNKQELSQPYRFRDEVGYNRGLTAFFHDEFLRLGISYHFPFLYPETGIPSVLYVSRIRLNPFFDWGQLKAGHKYHNYQTSGLELLFDIKWFNQYPFPIGFRYSLITSGKTRPTDQFTPYQVFLPIVRF